MSAGGCDMQRRYGSRLEFFVAAFVPAPRRLGRPLKTDLREIVNVLH
jgi:hypothetical protein